MGLNHKTRKIKGLYTPSFSENRLVFGEFIGFLVEYCGFPLVFCQYLGIYSVVNLAIIQECSIFVFQTIVPIMRKLLSVLFSFFVFIASAQSSSAEKEAARKAPDSQIQKYISQAKAQGYSKSAVENILRAQGATYQDLARLSVLWNGSDEASEEEMMEQESIASDFGLDVNTVDAPAETRAARFGAAFFNRVKLTETPELYIATPLDYQLGPGDDLSIQLFGASEEMYEVQISREGFIKVPRLAPLYLSGLSVSQAKARIKNAFSKIYAGLSVSSDQASKVDLLVSLRSARSVVINISGNVQVPGTYTISAFSSVLNALYAAGGPNEVGTYRDIRIIRNGKLLQSIDLYDFFLEGTIPTLYLKDQDIIQVPAFQKEVELKGGFKTTGFFELTETESLHDLLLFSGGFSSNAYKERVLINRINGYKRETLSSNLKDRTSLAIEDGDVISANLINDVVENGVSIEGAVYLPGLYSLSSVTTVGSLLEASRGLTLEAFPARATLFRKNYAIESIAQSIDLQNPSDLSIILRGGDRLFIPSSKDLLDFGVVTITGEVQSPGEFTYREGMRISDLISLSDGLNVNANNTAIILYRQILDAEGITTTTTTTISLDGNLVPEENIPLQPNDFIVVRLLSGYKPIEKVTLEGFVKNQGVYALKGSDYRLYDLLQESGGFLEDAYLPGISVTRKVLSTGGANQRVIKKAVESAATIAGGGAADEDIEAAEAQQVAELENESIIIGIDGDKLMSSRGDDSKNNIVLKEGDIITVPKLDNTITVLGEVQQSAKLTFRPGLTVNGAIHAAGGLSDKALKSRVYVVYQNGAIKSRRSVGLGLIRLDPKLEPGATVVVPEKLPREGGSALGEIVGYTSTLATLALLIRQLGI